MKHEYRGLILALLISSPFISSALFAQTSGWTGASDDNWSNPLNWSPNIAPNDLTESGAIAAAAVPVKFDETFEIGGVTLGAGVTLQINPGEVLHYYGEALANDGVIEISDDASLGVTSMRVFVDTEIAGFGRIDLLDPAGNGQANLETGLGAVITQGPDHTIAGHGTVTAFLVNNGTITGDDSDETLRLLSTEVTNHALLLGTQAGTLQLSGVALDQSPTGVIRAEENGVVSIDTTTISGGSIETATDGRVQVTLPNFAEFTGVENLGLLEVIAGGQLRISGSEFVNHGEIVLDPTDSQINSRLQFETAGVLDGTGVVEIRNFSTLTIVPPTLTQRMDHTLRGDGFISGDLVNEGTLAPGRPVGVLTSNGGYVQATSGRLQVDIAGSALGTFDRVTFEDDVALGGTLEINLSPGFTPTLGESIEIVSITGFTGAVAGEFDELILPASDTITYTVRYETDAVFLDVIPATHFMRGDCNVSGDTDVSDVVWLLGHLFPIGGANPIDCRDACDSNDDGTVDISDVIELLNALFGVPATILVAPNGVCGADPTADGLDCLDYPPCP